MDDRIIKYYQNQLSDEECQSLLEDCQTDAELKRQMMEYRNLLAMLSLHPALTNEAEGEKQLKAMLTSTTPSPMKVSRRFSLKWLRYVAVLAILLSAVTTAYWLHRHQAPAPVAMCSLSVTDGNTVSTVLSDGTKVWLNAGSTLTYPKTFGSQREVQLSGEGYFEVAKHKGKFIVHSGPINVTVLGTHFTVSNYRHCTPSVSLLQGSVCVAAKGTPSVVLRPNEKAVFSGHRLNVEQIDDDPTLWMQGIFAFSGETMDTILKRLSIYYNTKIIVRNTALKNEKFTGKMRKSDGLDECLALLRRIYNFDVETETEQNNLKTYIIK